MEKDVTLDDLARRYPDVEKDVENTEFDVQPPNIEPPQKPRGGNDGPYLNLFRDVLLGLLVSIMVSYARKYGYVP